VRSRRPADAHAAPNACPPAAKPSRGPRRLRTGRGRIGGSVRSRISL